MAHGGWPRGISSFLWDPQGQDQSVVMLSNRYSTGSAPQSGANRGQDAITLPPNAVAAAKVERPGELTFRMQMPDTVKCVNAGAMDPHHSDVVAVAADTGIYLCDVRQRPDQPAALATLSKSAHSLGARCVTYNPNRIYYLCSGGEDGCIRFWDTRLLRGTTTPASPDRDYELPQAHEHYIHTVLYNPYHDQLLLSSSSDHTAKMWSIPSVAFRPQSDNNAAETDVTHSLKDGLLRTLNDFGDTVCAAAWSCSGPWVYAAVSYNGKILVDQVPGATKMALLMAHES